MRTFTVYIFCEVVHSVAQEIVDNLLEREPGGSGVHPDAIIDDVMVEGEGEVPTLHDSHNSSACEEDIESEGSEEDDEAELDDNFNSAGEEVTAELCV